MRRRGRVVESGDSCCCTVAYWRPAQLSADDGRYIEGRTRLRLESGGRVRYIVVENKDVGLLINGLRRVVSWLEGGGSILWTWREGREGQGRGRARARAGCGLKWDGGNLHTGGDGTVGWLWIQCDEDEVKKLINFLRYTGREGAGGREGGKVRSAGVAMRAGEFRTRPVPMVGIHLAREGAPAGVFVAAVEHGRRRIRLVLRSGGWETMIWVQGWHGTRRDLIAQVVRALDWGEITFKMDDPERFQRFVQLCHHDKK